MYYLQAGSVVGLDLSQGEVQHATTRADSRGVTNVQVHLQISMG